MDAATFKADCRPALPPDFSAYSVHLATTSLEVLEAQRLRYQIFALEKGARIDGGGEGLDSDPFDCVCDHILVRDRWGRLIGTTRALRQENAQPAGFYSETEFELMPALRWGGKLLEIGRTCIHPAHRNGAAIGMLWSGIADLVFAGGYDRLIGCASIDIDESGFGPVRALVDTILARHLADEGRRARPKIPLPSAPAAPACAAPPLLKAYLRLGAQICGDAFYDADFACADLLVLVDRERLNLRYARHFLKAS